jgi:hypothetical protein
MSISLGLVSLIGVRRDIIGTSTVGIGGTLGIDPNSSIVAIRDGGDGGELNLGGGDDGAVVYDEINSCRDGELGGEDEDKVDFRGGIGDDGEDGGGELVV